ncbi:MAG: DUF2070 family protein [Candidatus Bathyarchaeota archaeon]|nr:DUF2070 family protein [Candidatus Bathyarchaeota archaeon]
MAKAASRYSSLFTLPSNRAITLALCLQCIITGATTELPFNPSFHELSVGLFLGLLLFVATSFGNYLTARHLLRKDLVLDLRRTSFLSLVSNLALFISAFIATLTSTSSADPSLWFKITSLGVFTSLSLRFLVFHSISFVSPWKACLSVILQPALFLVPLTMVSLPSYALQGYAAMYFCLAGFTAFLGVHVFVASLNTVGMKTLGIPSIRMFKAFIANWAEDLEKPLEDILEQLSEERGVKVSAIVFRTKEKLKAVIVVPAIHPGPFKNIGSSSIPSSIQKALEEKLGCVVSVPHGISGHETDLASHAQNEKVLNRILEASGFEGFDNHATPFLSATEEGATVGCQIFGDCALLTLTLAPDTMEDLPLELNVFIIQAAKKEGLAWAAPIDAHNSIQGPFDARKAIAPLKKAVLDVLEKASNCERSRFEVGAAKVTPTDFNIEEGIGPGGISVVVTKVNGQKTAYITVDGNNMVSGLREKVLSSLRELGIDGGEVLTTDTHIVNAVVLADRGYHPVGEMTDHKRLIKYIRTAVTEALRHLEPAEASWRQMDIEGVKVIGERQIDGLCLMVDEAAKKAKKTSAVVFPAVGIILTVLLFLF